MFFDLSVLRTAVATNVTFERLFPHLSFWEQPVTNVKNVTFEWFLPFMNYCTMRLFKDFEPIVCQLS